MSDQVAGSWQSGSEGRLLAQLPTPVIVVTTQGRVVFGNESAAELFDTEMPFDEVSVLDLLTQHERTRLNPLAWMEKWANSPNAPELDYVYLTCQTSTGQEKQLSVRVARADLGGTPHYLVTMHDMSRWLERWHTERDSHRVAARILSITADGVLMTDEELVITYANSSAEHLFGYAQGELVGKPLAELIPSRFRGAHIEHVARFVKEPQPSRLMSQRTPVTGLTKDGREVPIQASITRLSVSGRAVFSALLRPDQPDN